MTSYLRIDNSLLNEIISFLCGLINSQNILRVNLSISKILNIFITWQFHRNIDKTNTIRRRLIYSLNVDILSKNEYLLGTYMGRQRLRRLRLAFQLIGTVIVKIYNRVILFAVFGGFVFSLYFLDFPVSQPILGK